jgi:hypothetical protein
MTTIWVRATNARVRVWRTADTLTIGRRTADTLTIGPDADVVRLLQWLQLDIWGLDASQKGLVRNDERIAKWVLRRLEKEIGDSLAAVEYVNGNGDGVVLYPDWK